MASNIKVALTLDDKDYQNKLKAAEASARAFSSKAASGLAQVNAAFTGLAAGADTLRTKMDGLGAAITGLAFTAFIANLARSSSAIKDVSEAFGITLTSALELEAGFRRAGRSTDDMTRVLASVGQSAQDANDGSFALRDSFGKLGISMDFLKKNDLPTTIKQIAQVMKENAGNTEILNAGYNILGKTAKGMPMNDLLDGLQAASGQMGPAAKATDAFDTALKSMEANAAAVTREFKILVTPIVEAFNAFTSGADNSKAAAMLLAGAMAVFAGGAVIVGINSVVQAFRGLAVTFGLVSAGGATATAITAGYTATAGASAAASIVQAAGLARVATAQMAVNVAQIELNILVGQGIIEGGVYDSVINKLALSQARLATMTEAAALTQGQLAAATGGAAVTATAATGAFAGMMASLGAMALAAARFLGVVALITAAVLVINQVIKAAFDVDPIDAMAKKLESLVKEYFPGLHAAIEKTGQYLGMASGSSTKEQAYKPLERPNADYSNEARGAALRHTAPANQAVITGPTLNPMAATEESLRAQGKLREFNLGLDQRRLALQKDMVGLDEFDRAVRQSASDVEIKRLQEELRLTDEIKKLRITANNDKEGAGKYRGQLDILQEQLKTIKNQTDTTTILVGQVEAAKMVEKSRLEYNVQIVEQIKRQYELQQKFADAQMAASQALKDVQFAGEQQGRSPLERQIAEITRGARKAYEAARESLTSGFNEEGASPQDIANMVVQLSNLKKSYEDLGAEQVRNLETTRSWTYGVTDAWKTFKDAATNNADLIKNSFDNSMKGLEDAFVTLATTGKLSFKDLANSIIADLARIAFKKAIVGMASLFGFAAGGQVMSDTPIIVGERGPELFVPRSAGAIVPNNALGGMANRSNEGGGQTAVTYNIQAVDAASFRSLVSRDPSFIYAVTEQGRRSQPSRSR